jgi:flagellar hook-associated protein 2
MNARLATIEAGYRAQFTALDVLMGQLQTTSAYLTQQLAAISNNTPK